MDASRLALSATQAPSGEAAYQARLEPSAFHTSNMARSWELEPSADCTVASIFGEVSLVAKGSVEALQARPVVPCRTPYDVGLSG